MWKRMVVLGILAAAAGCANGTRETPSGGPRFEVAVTDTGFAPATLAVPAGKPVTLVVTRKSDQTCAKEILFPEQHIRKALPLNQPVEVALPALPKGAVRYSCGMEMVYGEVVAQ